MPLMRNYVLNAFLSTQWAKLLE